MHNPGSTISLLTVFIGAHLYWGPRLGSNSIVSEALKTDFFYDSWNKFVGYFSPYGLIAGSKLTPVRQGKSTSQLEYRTGICTSTGTMQTLHLRQCLIEMFTLQ